MATQYLRKTSLIVFGNPPVPGGTGLGVPAAPALSSTPTQPTTNQGGPGLELGALRVQFSVNAMDVDVPPTAMIRVLNLSETTATKVKNEFQNVTLQAGYENGNFGVIFQGTIIRVRKGRVNNIDNFLDIMASNLDILYNFGFANTSIKAGQNYKAQANNLVSSVNSSPAGQAAAQANQQLQLGNTPDQFLQGGVLPRGKVLFGLWPDYLNKMTDTTGNVWSIGPDGKVNIHPLTGYLPGEAVAINAQTGMIGVPVATTQGIEVNCLLNPLIKPGTLIKLNNADITTTSNQFGGAGFPAYSDIQFFANTSTDGTYMALVVEHEGDSRGTGGDWLTKIVALAVDKSGSSGAGSIPAYG